MVVTDSRTSTATWSDDEDGEPLSGSAARPTRRPGSGDLASTVAAGRNRPGLLPGGLRGLRAMTSSPRSVTGPGRPGARSRPAVLVLDAGRTPSRRQSRAGAASSGGESARVLAPFHWGEGQPVRRICQLRNMPVVGGAGRSPRGEPTLQRPVEGRRTRRESSPHQQHQHVEHGRWRRPDRGGRRVEQYQREGRRRKYSPTDRRASTWSRRTAHRSLVPGGEIRCPGHIGRLELARCSWLIQAAFLAGGLAFLPWTRTCPAARQFSGRRFRASTSRRVACASCRRGAPTVGGGGSPTTSCSCFPRPNTPTGTWPADGQGAS
jgi:hypothetical protein